MPNIHPTPAERQRLLDDDLRSAGHEERLRVHNLLLLVAGDPWTTVGAVALCVNLVGYHPG